MGRTRTPVKLTETEIDDIIALLNEGHTLTDISVIYNTEVYKIRNLINSSKYYKRLIPYYECPKNHGFYHHPLDSEFIKNIAADILANYPIDQIARKYNLSYSCVKI